MTSTEELRQTISVPLPAPLRVRAFLFGVLASLLLAGYLRFNAGHPGWGRLLVTFSLVSFCYSVFRFARRADAHYRARPWDFPIDQSRLWTHQQERGREVRAQGERRYLMSGVGRLAPPLTCSFYGALVLLPGLPPMPSALGIPEFLLWAIFATALSLPPAAYLMCRGWRRTRTEQSRTKTRHIT